jgi:DNA-directed RNA polymerase I, II, and III subunit RPABC2
MSAPKRPARTNPAAEKKEVEGAGRRGATKKNKPVAPTKVVKVAQEVQSDDDDDVDEQDVDALVEQVSNKLQFHIFNPDKYEIETHRHIIIVPPEHRKTSERLTEYEYTEVISHRAKQIENGGTCFANVGDETNPIVMAEMEIAQKLCPLSIRRLHNHLVGEMWEVNEMIPP